MKLSNINTNNTYDTSISNNNKNNFTYKLLNYVKKIFSKKNEIFITDINSKKIIISFKKLKSNKQNDFFLQEKDGVIYFKNKSHLISRIFFSKKYKKSLSTTKKILHELCKEDSFNIMNEVKEKYNINNILNKKISKTESNQFILEMEESLVNGFNETTEEYRSVFKKDLHRVINDNFEIKDALNKTTLKARDIINTESFTRIGEREISNEFINKFESILTEELKLDQDPDSKFKNLSTLAFFYNQGFYALTSINFVSKFFEQDFFHHLDAHITYNRTGTSRFLDTKFHIISPDQVRITNKQIFHLGLINSFGKSSPIDLQASMNFVFDKKNQKCIIENFDIHFNNDTNTGTHYIKSE